MLPLTNPSERRIFSVSEITRDLKMLIEDSFASVWLRGEISNFKSYASGHFYFTLKDAGAQLAAVMFKGHNQFLKFLPEDGMGVIVHGRITIYEAQGRHQILVDHIEPDGVGALQTAFEQLKKKLATEGLFAAERKRPLPFLPRTVGLITSLHGAAIHDILSVLRRRYRNIGILIYPVKVQGDGAKEEIVRALDYFSTTRTADVVIVGRGGGSIEDLWAFNEEAVARAVACSVVPVISAVGHETDFTICDFVADLRAPTPSAAAELCVPRKADLTATLTNLQSRLELASHNHLERLRKHVSHLVRRIPSPIKLWDRWRLKLGDLEDRLFQNVTLFLRRKSYDVAELKIRLPDPSMALGESRRVLDRHKSTLIHYFEKYLDTQGHRIDSFKIKLELLSPKNILRRGYLIARKPNDGIVARKSDLAAGDTLELLFFDGSVSVLVKLGEDGGR